MEFQGKSYTIQPRPGYLLCVPKSNQRNFSFSQSIQFVRNFYYEHLGKVFIAAKHQLEKYASFTSIRLNPHISLNILISEKRKVNHWLNWRNFPFCQKKNKKLLTQLNANKVSPHKSSLNFPNLLLGRLYSSETRTKYNHQKDTRKLRKCIFRWLGTRLVSCPETSPTISTRHMVSTRVRFLHRLRLRSPSSTPRLCWSLMLHLPIILSHLSHFSQPQ